MTVWDVSDAFIVLAKNQLKTYEMRILRELQTVNNERTSMEHKQTSKTVVTYTTQGPQSNNFRSMIQKYCDQIELNNDN